MAQTMYIDRTKTILDAKEMFFQAEFDFGYEFNHKTPDKLQVVSYNVPTTDYCHLCDEEKVLTTNIPIGLDGMERVATPYSDLICSVCSDCYDKFDGDVIWKLYDRRMQIMDEVRETRSLLKRIVIVEKLQKKQ